jgi:hypothetical protein
MVKKFLEKIFYIRIRILRHLENEPIFDNENNNKINDKDNEKFNNKKIYNDKENDLYKYKFFDKNFDYENIKKVEFKKIEEGNGSILSLTCLDLEKLNLIFHKKLIESFISLNKNKNEIFQIDYNNFFDNPISLLFSNIKNSSHLNRINKINIDKINEKKVKNFFMK